MAGELIAYVHVTNPDTGRTEVYGPGDDVPSGVAEQITNPAAWAEGKAPRRARSSRHSTSSARSVSGSASSTTDEE